MTGDEFERWRDIDPYEASDDVIVEAISEEEAIHRRIPEAIQDMESIAVLLRLTEESLDEGTAIDPSAVDTLRELFDKYRHEGNAICTALYHVIELRPLADSAAGIDDIT